MKTNEDESASDDFALTQGQSGRFATTHWSVVLRAGQDDPAGSAALEQLCRAYWVPIYCFIRRTRDAGHDDAADLTQGFFCEVLERKTINRAKPTGKFRTFLLKVLTGFLANESDKRRTIKRGGRIKFISLEEAQAGGQYEQVEQATPEKVFDRTWAAAVLNRVLARLEKEYLEAGKEALYKELEPKIVQVEDGFYAQCARRLDASPGSIKVARHRFRQRYRDLLREEVAQTVTNPREIEDEIRYLLAVAGS